MLSSKHDLYKMCWMHNTKMLELIERIMHYKPKFKTGRY